jgi:hypothetical protein
MKSSEEIQDLIQKMEVEFLEMRIAYAMGPNTSVVECAKIIKMSCDRVISLVDQNAG